MIKKDIQTARRLVNSLINEISERWAQNENGKCYLIRHTRESDDTHIAIQPTYSDTFYCLEDFIHVAEVCGCSLYMSCTKNQDGIMTPTLYIY